MNEFGPYALYDGGGGGGDGSGGDGCAFSLGESEVRTKHETLRNNQTSISFATLCFCALTSSPSQTVSTSSLPVTIRSVFGVYVLLVYVLISNRLANRGEYKKGRELPKCE